MLQVLNTLWAKSPQQGFLAKPRPLALGGSVNSQISAWQNILSRSCAMAGKDASSIDGRWTSASQSFSVTMMHFFQQEMHPISSAQSACVILLHQGHHRCHSYRQQTPWRVAQLATCNSSIKLLRSTACWSLAGIAPPNQMTYEAWSETYESKRKALAACLPTFALCRSRSFTRALLIVSMALLQSDRDRLAAMQPDLGINLKNRLARTLDDAGS